jgi:membrane-bound acyltransferase YfiQ involved in biofilm formation
MLTALSLAFCFTTSPFVFLFFSLAGGMYAILNYKALINVGKKEPVKLIALAIIGLLIFLLVTWRMILGISGRSTFVLSDMCVPVFEILNGSNR